MDITLIFKTCVKTIRTRNRACGFPEPDRPRPEPRVPGVFAVRAREVMHQIAKLGAFVADTSAAYANFSGHIPGAPQMTDTERDRIDLGIPRLSNEAKKMLNELETLTATTELLPQHREHQLGVLKLMKEYLRYVSGVHSDLRAERVARAEEARRLSRLDARTRVGDSSVEKPVIPTWTPQEDDVAVENLSAEELQVFEEENAALQAELSGLQAELRQLEGTVTGVARLQEQFTEKIVEQERDIDQVASAVIGTTETLKDANEQLRQAIQRNAGLRVYILFFLLVMSFSLLFLDWYNP